MMSASGAQAAPAQLVAGSVRDGGSAVVGTPVALVAWPSNAVQVAGVTGARVPLKTVQTAVTGAGGRYSFPAASLAGIGQTYVNPDGSVNLEVVGAGAHYGFSAAMSDSPAAADPSLATAGRTETLNMDTGSGTMTSALGGVRESSPLVVAPSGRTANLHPEGARPDFCYTSYGSYVKNRPEKFLDLYTNGHYANAKVLETTASSHSLGIGIKFQGEGWSAGGSSTIGASHTNGALSPLLHRSYRIYNTVTYRYYHVKCALLALSHTDLRPLKLTGLLTHYSHTHTSNFQTCQNAPKGARFTKDAGSNYTFAAGVHLGVVNVSAHAAFSKNTKLAWAFVKHGTMCGNHGKGWLHAQVAGAQPRQAGCSAIPQTAGEDPNVIVC